jgi:hypothetical protein
MRRFGSPLRGSPTSPDWPTTAPRSTTPTPTTSATTRPRRRAQVPEHHIPCAQEGTCQPQAHIHQEDTGYKLSCDTCTTCGTGAGRDFAEATARGGVAHQPSAIVAHLATRNPGEIRKS